VKLATRNYVLLSVRPGYQVEFKDKKADELRFQKLALILVWMSKVKNKGTFL